MEAARAGAHSSFCQLADTPPHDPFSASCRSSCFDIFLSGVRFPRVYLNISSPFLLFVLALLLIFACAKNFAPLGSKTRVFAVLEHVLYWKSRFDCILREIRRFFLSVSMLSQTLVVMTPFLARKHPCGNHVNHVATMLTSTTSPSVFAEHPRGNHVNVQKDSVRFCRASMWQPC